MKKTSLTKLPRSVTEKIGHYVYVLTHPRTGRPFYVGKGKGNRVFAHINASLKRSTANDKLSIIRKLRSKGRCVGHEILRHGLTSKEAFEVESTLIDFIGREALTNIVQGYKADARGRMRVEEVIAKYSARPIRIREPAVLIVVNQAYRRGMKPSELFDVTCGDWVVGSRRDTARYAFSVYGGVVRAVYKIIRWRRHRVSDRSVRRRDRWFFDGTPASALSHYVGKDVSDYLNQNPIRYVNC